jgi:carboxymethylenebutenolidase
VSTRTLTPVGVAPFDTHHVLPTEARRGGLVICHAVWGVTPHLRALAETFAAEGYEVLVPDLFEPAGTPFPARDTDPSLLAAQSAKAEASGWGAACLPRIRACIDALANPVFVMGFCFGGTATWLAACRCEGIAVAACFYGGQIAQYSDETPRCPTILHFGKTDELIPTADVDAIRERHPDVPIHEYGAGHAFVAPSGYHKDSADLALLRTRALFHRAAGKGEHGA